MLNTPNSTPNMTLHLEHKIMPVQYRICYLQLRYLKNILSKNGSEIVK